MCMVAQGCVDAYYEYGVHCWDIAAGVVIVREAGGTCTHPAGEVGGGVLSHTSGTGTCKL